MTTNSPDPQTSRSDRFVSTGVLPTPAIVQAMVDETHVRFRTDRDGELSGVYPALGRVAPELFGMCVVGVSGTTCMAGDA